MDDVEIMNIDDPIITTNNSLADIIGWLRRGAYVVIYSKSGRFFHKCSKTTLTAGEIKDYINSHRFIYINVSKTPGLLDDGEWNWYINNEGFEECKCSLKNISSLSSNVPYKEMLSL